MPNQITGANAGGSRQLPMRTQLGCPRRSVLALGVLTIMQRRRTFIYAVAIIMLMFGLTAVLPLIPTAGPPQLAFSILRYTNEVTQVRALVEVTNASKHEFLWRLFTESPSNQVWVVSDPKEFWGNSTQVVPSMGRRQFWITMPPDPTEWRLRCHLWKKMNPTERKFDSLLCKVGLRWPFHTTFKMAKPDLVVSSPSFYRLPAQPDGAANESQPIRSETNRVSSPAGSRR